MNLNKYEELLEEAAAEQISVDENVPFSGRLKGLYIDSNIALSDSLETTAERTFILAEELGHHYTSHGNILNPSHTSNCKQEHRARMYAYDRLIGLQGIINAYEHGCREYFEVADYLEIPEKELREALQKYRNKYGTYVRYKNYYLTFEPYLSVGKLL